MADTDTEIELRYRRIALYGAISVGLHESEELWMDACEIPSAGWTARNGDEDGRRQVGVVVAEMELERVKHALTSLDDLLTVLDGIAMEELVAGFLDDPQRVVEHSLSR
ncbi:hypothetical protein NKG99_07530 [Mesorhizobium sp. M1409]|uniref:hypothetical protein n=1 Tax=unclassified Mesorhizobium TaxID=325217 RepID=UPI0033363606